MGSRISPGDVESRRQSRTLRQKNRCDRARKTWVRMERGAVKTPENGRTNPSGGKWARGVTRYGVQVGAGIDRGSGLDKMFIENATKNIGFVSCSWSVVSCGAGGRPSVVRTAATLRVPETRAERVSHRSGSDGERPTSHGKCERYGGSGWRPRFADWRPVGTTH